MTPPKPLIAKSTNASQRAASIGGVQTEKKKVVPRDFARRVSSKIVSINALEPDETEASNKTAALVYRNMGETQLYSQFLELIDIFLAEEEHQKYGGTTWVSMLWQDEEFPDYVDFVKAVVKQTIEWHIYGEKPQIIEESSGKPFSHYAYTLGESFIQMMKLNSDLYDFITIIYGEVIHIEMERENLRTKEKEKEKRRKISGRKVSDDKQVVNVKKLYDDIIDYVSQRGEFRTDTLNQKNPNEFILVLADRMRSTRRYIIQDIMNRFALERKKQLERDLKEKEATAEEIIIVAKPFNTGLHLYWIEKRYNFKYLAVEKVRIALQVLGMLMGTLAIAVGYIEIVDLSLIESLIAGGLMFVVSKTLCSRKMFENFYPVDVTEELEKNVSLFTPVVRKMSQPQLYSFFYMQIRSEDNTPLVHLLPEYVRYIFSVMPDRKNLLITREESNEMMDHLELKVSRVQRGR